MENDDHGKRGGDRRIRGPANDTVPTKTIRNRLVKENGILVYTYRGVLGDDLAIGQSQKTLVDSRLVQLWGACKIARCGYRRHAIG